MRPRILIAMGVIVAVVAGAALILSLVDESDDVGDIVLATAISQGTNAPLDDVSEFPAETTEVYATLEVRDRDAGETFAFRWIGDPNEEPVETEHALEEDVEDETWVYSRLEHPQGLPPGTYTVEVRHDGDLVDSADFTVGAE